MLRDQDIDAWRSAGIITQAQAERMLADLSARRKDRASDKLIMTVSTIGALLLGIGAILFVSANWQGFSHWTKSLILAGSTFAVTAAGYWIGYETKTLPRVGTALVFLGTLLLGATIFFFAQMYHVQANSHVLVLLWLAGVLPLIYLLRSTAIAGLSLVLGFVWFGLFVFRGMMFDWHEFPAFPVLYLLAGVLTFEVGGLHYTIEGLGPIARVYRIGALKVMMASLFLLTFEFISGKEWFGHAAPYFSPQITLGIVLIGAAAAAGAAVNGLKNPSRSETITLETRISLGLTALTLLYFLMPLPHTNVYPVLFNLAMAGCILAFIAVGYRREDLWLVNFGMSALGLLVLVRYCDFFWELLPRSLFFMIGGALLVLGGIALERQRRTLQVRFAHHGRPQ
ncbi:MAG: DUF2157 domain-containing protein [Candidatus Omnitrophica bacterium]|nr:DUF2157 domain-containing protein [Candidatus Omnitrophota bacterium]